MFSDTYTVATIKIKMAAEDKLSPEAKWDAFWLSTGYNNGLSSGALQYLNSSLRVLK